MVGTLFFIDFLPCNGLLGQSPVVLSVGQRSTVRHPLSMQFLTKKCVAFIRVVLLPQLCGF